MSETPDPLRAWLDDLHRRGRSPHTIQAYARALRHFIAWEERAYQLPFEAHKVMPRDVRDWKSYQQTTEKASPATINQRLVAVTRFFRWAVAQKHCADNPAEDVGGIHLAARRPKALKTADLRRLLRAARGSLRDYALIELLAGTGLRVGELLALRVGDVEMSERSGRVVVRRGKHGGYREIPLTGDVRRALNSYLTGAHPDPANPDAPLWIGKRGGLSSRSSVMRLLAKYARHAGIAPVNPHALRHTFATRYLNANPDDLRGLARLLGHANLNTVMVYTEPDMEDLAARMERVEGGP